MKEKFFNLSEGEKIIEEIKPQYRLRYYYFVTMFLPLAFLMMIFGVNLLVFMSVFKRTVWVTIIGILFNLSLLLIPWLLSGNKYEKEYYWITNKRIVYKRGILGYRITSIPYERVSDVMISRTFLERIFGIAGVHVQSLSGQITSPLQGAGLGAEGSLNAVLSPEDLQETIFKLIKLKRKEEHLTF